MPVQKILLATISETQRNGMAIGWTMTDKQKTDTVNALMIQTSKMIHFSRMFILAR